MTRENKQQFAVYAHYSDGSVEDVTPRPSTRPTTRRSPTWTRPAWSARWP